MHVWMCVRMCVCVDACVDVCVCVCLQPGMMTQVTRMGKLVEDLKRQEAGYLSILLKLLVITCTGIYLHYIHNVSGDFN